MERREHKGMDWPVTVFAAATIAAEASSEYPKDAQTSREISKQGRRHNGDQAAQRPQMMCSICGR